MGGLVPSTFNLALRFCRALLTLSLLCLAVVASPAFATVVVLDAKNAPIDLAANARVWVDTTGLATVEQVDALPDSQFVPIMKRNEAPQGYKQAIWLRYELQPAQTGVWFLNAKQVTIDQVSLYTRIEGGKWLAQHAGTHVPVAEWPIVDMRPTFELDVHAGENVRVHVRAHDVYGSWTGLQALPSKMYLHQQFKERLILGLYVGVTLVVVFLGLANFATWREPVWLSYAVYNLLMTLGQLSTIGLTGTTLFDRSPRLYEFFGFMLAPMAAAFFVFFSVQVSQGYRFAQFWSKLAVNFAFLLLFWGLLTWFFRTGFHDQQIHGMYVSNPVLRADFMVQAALLLAFTCGILGCCVMLVAWRRGYSLAGQSLVAMALVIPSALPQVFYSLHLMPRSLATEYFIVVGLVAESVAMLYLLQRHSRRQAVTSTRLQSLGLHDALTGLLPRATALADMHDLFERFASMSFQCPVLYVSLDNVQELARKYGHETADVALLVTARQLHKMHGSGDIVARVGPNSFVLAISSLASKNELRSNATAMVAGGLAEEPPLKPHMKRDIRVWIGQWDPRTHTAMQVVETLDSLAATPLPEGSGKRIEWVTD